MKQYFGTYQTFDAYSKDAAGILLGADCLVGDVFDMRVELHEGEHRAVMTDKFGHDVALFNPHFSRKLSVFTAGGMKIKAILSFVAFTEKEEGGLYWGEAAVFAYNPLHEQAFERFIAGIGLKIQENIRPRIDFGREGVDKIIESKGSWVPDQSIPMPPRKKGTVIMKDHRTLSEKLIEQGRAKNAGCYFASWAFIALIIAALAYAIYHFVL